MKLKKIYSLSLATVLLATPACTITTLAQENTVSHNLTTVASPRFAYIQEASIKIDPSSTGINYSVLVSGIREVTSISGKTTIYKGSSQIYSKNLSTNTNTLRKSGSISTKGAGSYTIKFSGTVYTKTGSEPITLEMEDSYN